MALDEAILQTTDAPVLRVYSWDRPSVSFGVFQTVAEVQARFPGRALVRRWTGGGAVEHGEDFTFSLILPRSDSRSTMRSAASYVWIHRAVLEAMQPTAASLVCDIPAPVGGWCFEKPAPGDILLNGAKICGGAQRRSRHGLLHQGSIQRVILPADFPIRLCEALGVGTQPFHTGDSLLEMAAVLDRERYGSEAWTNGRTNRFTT